MPGRFGAVERRLFFTEHVQHWDLWDERVNAMRELPSTEIRSQTNYEIWRVSECLIYPRLACLLWLSLDLKPTWDREPRKVKCQSWKCRLGRSDLIRDCFVNIDRKDNALNLY